VTANQGGQKNNNGENDCCTFLPCFLPICHKCPYPQHWFYIKSITSNYIIDSIHVNTCLQSLLLICKFYSCNIEEIIHKMLNYYYNGYQTTSTRHLTLTTSILRCSSSTIDAFTSQKGSLGHMSIGCNCMCQSTLGQVNKRK
jgi:hypothetical protein